MARLIIHYMIYLVFIYKVFKYITKNEEGIWGSHSIVA